MAPSGFSQLPCSDTLLLFLRVIFLCPCYFPTAITQRNDYLQALIQHRSRLHQVLAEWL